MENSIVVDASNVHRMRMHQQSLHSLRPSCVIVWLLRLLYIARELSELFSDGIVPVPSGQETRVYEVQGKLLNQKFQS